MKKYLLLCGVALSVSACGGFVKNKNGSEFLTRLDKEPIGCTFMYKIQTDVSVYNIEDARRYMENAIIEKAITGNAYWITSQTTKQNDWVIFGPERSFVLNANIYNCPHLAPLPKIEK